MFEEFNEDICDDSDDCVIESEKLNDFRKSPALATKKKNYRFTCTLCFKNYSRRAGYAHHWSASHNDTSRMLMFKDSISCDKCGDVFFNKIGLFAHKSKPNSKCKDGESPLLTNQLDKNSKLGLLPIKCTTSTNQDNLCKVGRLSLKRTNYLLQLQKIILGSTKRQICTSREISNNDNVACTIMKPAAAPELPIKLLLINQPENFDTDMFVVRDLQLIPVVVVDHLQNFDAQFAENDPNLNQKYPGNNEDLRKNENIFQSEQQTAHYLMPNKSVDEQILFDTTNDSPGISTVGKDDNVKQSGDKISECIESLLSRGFINCRETSLTVDCIKSDSQDLDSIPVECSEQFHEDIDDRQGNEEFSNAGLLNFDLNNYTPPQVLAGVSRDLPNVEVVAMQGEFHIGDKVDGVWKCSLCLSMHDTIEYLESHWDATHKELAKVTTPKLEPHICRVCQQVFSRRTNYRKHFMKQHSEYTADHMYDEGWKCSECFSVYRSIKGLQVHWQKNHKEIFDAELFSKFIRQQKSVQTT